MRSTRYGSLAFASIMTSALLVASASGATVLNGAHDNNSDGDGYDIPAAGDYIVPADVGGVPQATFNNNSVDGLYLTDGVSLTINGGQFNNNTTGLDIISNAHNTDVTINGGSFVDSGASSDAIYDYGAALTINGGNFDYGYGIWAYGQSVITIKGGTFSHKTVDFLFNRNTSFDVYGDFTAEYPDLQPGQTVALTVAGTAQSFTGKLLYADAPQSFTYKGVNGTLTLHQAVPEPTAIALLGTLAAGGLLRRRRR